MSSHVSVGEQVARVVAERDMYRTLLERLKSSVSDERCGFCGEPVSGPGLCGLPGTHPLEEES